MLSAEQQLVRRAQNGDAMAFSELAESYRERLCRFLWLKSGDHGDAEDATQEALLNAWRYLPSYNNKWQFSTWLYRIGLRQLRRTNDVAESRIEPSVQDSVETQIDIDNIWKLARKTLPEDQLRALWLRYAEDASIREISNILGRSAAWVKVNLMRSRRRLAKSMDQRSKS